LIYSVVICYLRTKPLITYVTRRSEMRTKLTILVVIIILYANSCWGQQLNNEVTFTGTVQSTMRKSNATKQATNQSNYSIKIQNGETVKVNQFISNSLINYSVYSSSFLNVPSFINLYIDSVYSTMHSFNSIIDYSNYAGLTISAASNATPGNYTMEIIFNFYRYQGASISETDTTAINVTIYNQPPDKPQLALPPNNSINQHKNIVLQWNDVPTAISYIAQLSADQFFASIVKADTTKLDTVNITGLSGGQKYFWRVQARNSVGASSWSDTWNFTTDLEWEKSNASGSYTIKCFAWNGIDLYAGTDGGGILHSTDDGMNWNPINNGLTSLTVKAFQIIGNNLLAGAGAGIFLSTNKGSSWTKLSSTITDVTSFAKIGTSLFAGSYYSNGLYFSSDSGMTWTRVYSGLGINALAVLGTNIYAGTMWGIYSSKNYGQSWDSVNNNSIQCMVSANSTILAGTDNFQGLFISTNNGATWTNAGLEDNIVNALIARGPFVFACYSGVFCSTNNGNNWNSVDLGFPSYAKSALGKSLNYLFVGTSNGEIWRRPLIEMTGVNPPAKPQPVFPNMSQNISTNAVTFKWNNVQDATLYILHVSRDLSFASIIDKDSITTDTTITMTGLSGSQNYYWQVQAENEAGVSQWSDIWNFTSSLIGVETKGNIPNEFSLSQNFPNPFNPLTTITFGIPTKSFVSLKVFDMLGREVAIIVSEEISAGSYSRQWNAANMSSGIYFYRLHAGSFIETKKLVFLK
jgi:hypothetical protein